MLPENFSSIRRDRPLLAVTLAIALAAGTIGVGAASSAYASAPGEVYGTGYNPYGQLGDGTNEVQDSFAANPFLPPTVIEASAGREASLELLANGTVEGSGENIRGELGNGSEYARYVPEVLPGFSNVTAVSEGAYQSLALLSNGTVEASGLDEYGELGNGEVIASGGCNCLTSPTLVDGVEGAGKLEHVVAISDGYFGADALLSDGHVVTWGYAQYGDLGNGGTKESDVPVEVSGIGGKGKLEGVVAVSSGFYDSVALLANGQVVTWGYNVDGELGDGTTTQSDVPVEVLGVGGKGKLEHVLAVSAGGDFDLALLSNGKVLAWGYNHYAELGDGESKQSGVPVEVLGPGGSETLSNVANITANAYSALATTSSGALIGWGYNADGELGDGSFEEVTEPVLIPDVSGIVSLSHGSFNQDSLLVEGATAQLSATALGFAAYAGTASSPQSVTLTNAGPAPLVVSGVVLSGASAFSESGDTCTGATLPADGSCSVSLTFDPAATGGYGATLAFSSSAANTLPTVAIGGAAVAPAPAPTPKPAKPKVSIHKRGIALRKGHLRVTLSCSVEACEGKVRLTAAVEATAKGKQKKATGRAARTKPSHANGKPSQTNGKRSHANGKPSHAKRKTIVLGKASYRIAAGKHKVVSIPLTRRARALAARLKRGSPLRTTLTATVAGGQTAKLLLKLT